MSETDRLTLDKEEKWLAMFALDAVRLGHVALTDTRNPITKWRDRRRAHVTIRQIFQEGEPDEPYSVKDSEHGLISNSLKRALEERKKKGTEDSPESNAFDLKLEQLLSKVGPHASNLHNRN